jgi:hypothetical protein
LRISAQHFKEFMEPLKNLSGEIWLGARPQKADDCMDAGGRAMQEQLPSLHAVNECFGGA